MSATDRTRMAQLEKQHHGLIRERGIMRERLELSRMLIQGLHRIVRIDCSTCSAVAQGYLDRHAIEGELIDNVERNARQTDPSGRILRGA